jgi:hypothetical protein
MAGRILNRRELRKQADEAEQAGHAEAVAPDAALALVAPDDKPKAKPRAAPRVKKPRPKKAPPRMRARWGVFDASMKQVAVFDYNQRPAADQKLADLLGRKKGLYYLQIVKEPMPEPAPPAGPAVP